MSKLIGRTLPTEDFVVENVVDDSRLVKQGDVFICNSVSGGSLNFIADAKKRGARAIITNLQDIAGTIYTENVSDILSFWAVYKFPNHPKNLVAVTGTNGKTSVTWFYQQIVLAMGKNTGSIGTLGVYKLGEKIIDTGYTSPPPLKLHELLEGMYNTGVAHVCIEASSHALELRRLHGCKLKAAAFTNLTQDHLDFHENMDKYFTAKKKLFTEVLKADSIAVLNKNSSFFGELNKVCKSRNIKVLSYGEQNADIQFQLKRVEASGMDVELSYKDFKTHVTLPLIGVFQVDNLAAAIGLALASGLSFEGIAKALPRLSSVPGRMEVVVSNNLTAPTVVVDYAHTPDALKYALKSLRPLTKGKLWVVFGCGGGRDKTKRPLMGKIAANLADEVIITDDNPRSEDAATIRQEIMGTAGIEDRKKAIYHAIKNAKTGDVVLVAGKGHECEQIVGTQKIYFNDSKICKQALCEQMLKDKK